MQINSPTEKQDNNRFVLFTPQEPNTERIVNHITEAQSEILVQSYSFTSTPIINALIKAKKEVLMLLSF